jgi:hypothetical protein
MDKGFVTMSKPFKPVVKICKYEFSYPSDEGPPPGEIFPSG